MVMLEIIIFNDTLGLGSPQTCGFFSQLMNLRNYIGAADTFKMGNNLSNKY